MNFAIVGNGVMDDYGNLPEIIDSCDHVVRINRAIWHSYVEEGKNKVGSKTTIYSHNCWCEVEPSFYLPKTTEIWLTLPIKGPDNWVVDERGHYDIFKHAGFKKIYQFVEEDLIDLYMTYDLKHPTAGIRTIWYAVKQGITPTIFNFTQDDDMRHYFDKEKLPSTSMHEVLKERNVLNDLINKGLVIRHK